MKLNHALILVTNTDETSRFFEKTIGLRKGPRPAFKFYGTWLYDETGTPCIHIANAKEVNSDQATYLSQGPEFESHPNLQTINHLAFSSNSYEKFISRLINNNVAYVERNIPDSNEHQVFVTGPNELKIEILFNQNKS